MATALPERCWRAWWDELTAVERRYWRTSARRPFLSAEQVRLLRAEGLPLVTIRPLPSDRAGDQLPAEEQVLFPLDLADLLEQDARAS